MLLYGCIHRLLSNCLWRSSKWAESCWFGRCVVVVGVCSWAEWGSESEAPGDVAKFNLPQRSCSTLYWSSLYAVFSAFRNMA